MNSGNFIVIAKTGYQVVLTIGEDNLIVDAFNPLNLTDRYPQDVIASCSSLKSYLRDGLLVQVNDDFIPKADPHARSIASLRSVAETQLGATYVKSSETSTPNVRVRTESSVTPELASEIERGIEKGRDEILRRDQKLVPSPKSVEDPDSRPAERGPMTPEELRRMKVSFDVSPEEFMRRQKEAKLKNEANTRKIEADAQREISALYEAEESSK